MGLERVTKILANFGFSSVDTKVYVYLAKNGPLRGRDLTEKLGIVKQQLYPSLKRLQEKGVVNHNLKHPALFYALKLEELLDLYIGFNMNQLQLIKETKEELLNSLQNYSNQDNI